jgi:SAM-dependent methyltransferase
MHDHLIQQQIEYYRARAGEYDEWFLRKGRYDRGADSNRQWFVEIARLRSALRSFDPAGHVLELACGTGLWTQQLVRYADRVTAVDASPEVLELNRARAIAQSSPRSRRPLQLASGRNLRCGLFQFLALARSAGAVRVVLAARSILLER